MLCSKSVTDIKHNTNKHWSKSGYSVLHIIRKQLLHICMMVYTYFIGHPFTTERIKCTVEPVLYDTSKL